jgi:ribonuclease BN (tRNA processing enzyme)
MGFHALAKFNFPQGINVYGPKGLKAFFKSVINRPYTVPISELKTRIRLYEINNKSTILPADVIYRKLRHSSVCFGFRFLLEEKIVSYCTDTGLCKNLFLLAKNADLLISDCAFKAGQENKKWPHLNPRSAAKLARDAKAKQLALMHFDASLYLTLKERKDAQIQARRIFRKTFICQDNQEIML